ATSAPQHQLIEGSWADVAYDVPPDAFYFRASPQTSMPLAILLEVGLQPCGYLTAWGGAALEAGGEVFFRNLGGRATLHREVHPDAGTLTTRAELTSVSRSGGMILVFFRFAVRAGAEVVFEGETHIGYFTEAALAAQKGLRLAPEEEARR